MKTRILVADDAKFIRRVLRQILESQPDFEVVAETDNFSTTIERAIKLKPDMIVLDLHMPDLASDTASRVRSVLDVVPLKIIAISVWADEETKLFAYGCGAAVLLDKTNLAVILNSTVDRLMLRKTAAHA